MPPPNWLAELAERMQLLTVSDPRLTMPAPWGARPPVMVSPAPPLPPVRVAVTVAFTVKRLNCGWAALYVAVTVMPATGAWMVTFLARFGKAPRLEAFTETMPPA